MKMPPDSEALARLSAQIILHIKMAAINCGRGSCQFPIKSGRIVCCECSTAFHLECSELCQTPLNVVGVTGTVPSVLPPRRQSATVRLVLPLRSVLTPLLLPTYCPSPT
ncbi:hypothetical protein ECG_08646 [Echinococcus granulosus]|nr:hypothetical protein ECG_08646 [Echinococcus granulosus]